MTAGSSCFCSANRALNDWRVVDWRDRIEDERSRSIPSSSERGRSPFECWRTCRREWAVDYAWRMSAFLAPALGNVGIHGDGKVRPEYIVEGVAHRFRTRSFTSSADSRGVWTRIESCTCSKMRASVPDNSQWRRTRAGLMAAAPVPWTGSWLRVGSGSNSTRPCCLPGPPSTFGHMGWRRKSSLRRRTWRIGANSASPPYVVKNRS